MRYLAAVCLFWAVNLQAQVGVSYFAAQGFDEKQCNDALAAFAGVDNPTIAILWGTFTTHNLCLQRFLEAYARKKKIIEIHFSNEAGRRNKRLKQGELLRLNRANINRRAKKIKRFIDRYDDRMTYWLLSTGLEDEYSKRKYEQILYALYGQFGTRVWYVRSPLFARYLGGADFLELHDVRDPCPTKRPCIYNNDGRDIDFNEQGRGTRGKLSISDLSRTFRKKAIRGHICFYWWASAQGVHGSKFIEPRRRRFVLDRKVVSIVNKKLREIDRHD